MLCDPGEIRTLNQQNRNLSFYPLNYGIGSIPYKYNQKTGFATYCVTHSQRFPIFAIQRKVRSPKSEVRSPKTETEDGSQESIEKENEI